LHGPKIQNHAQTNTKRPNFAKGGRIITIITILTVYLLL